MLWIQTSNGSPWNVTARASPWPLTIKDISALFSGFQKDYNVTLAPEIFELFLDLTDGHWGFISVLGNIMTKRFKDPDEKPREFGNG